MLLTCLALVFGTLISEDLTCIAAGVLIGRGQLGLVAGIAACTAGIFAGDVGLWALGRAFGRAALAWPWMARRLHAARAADLTAWLRRHAAGAIVGSRFLPGTRLPLYVFAGVLKMPAAVFGLWAFIATMLWTPTIVLLTATLGDGFVVRMTPVVRAGWIARSTAAAVVIVGLRLAHACASSDARMRIRARLARWSRWEFWPMPIFYAPVAAWIVLLAIRYRGLSTLTAANPAMPDGGVVGESKFEILAKLPREWTIPAALIRRGTIADRLNAVDRQMDAAGWTFPIIVKPDVGQRGTGVKLARDREDVRAYFHRCDDDLVVQPFHPGPYEAGVFYYRLPGAARGRILSITDKRFPAVEGDGASTLERLIWAHPRYRLQADTFVARHRLALTRVLARGERFTLGIAGNHAQGALFLDGSHLITPALERRFDAIARARPGFHVGRFDVRYADVERFKAGDDLAIVELNGATSESTNIYDPRTPLWSAYRQLFRQWSIVFAIGAANREAGASVSPMRRLAQIVRGHLGARMPFPVSD